MVIAGAGRIEGIFQEKPFSNSHNSILQYSYGSNFYVA